MSKNDEVTPEQDNSGPQGAGAQLRDARESQGLRINTVAESLGLSASVISALEADDYASLGAPVYARGYIRKYARYLDLPSDDLVADYEAVSATNDPELQSHLAVNLAHGSNKSWVTAVAMVLLLIVIIAAAIWGWRYLRHGQEATRIPPSAAASAAPASRGAQLGNMALGETRNDAVLTAGTDSSVAASSSNAASAVGSAGMTMTPPRLPGTGAIVSADSSTPTASPSSSAPNKLVLHVKETSWIEVMAADHTRLYYDLAPTGATLDFTGSHGVLTVFLGNAPGVEVVVQGQPYAIAASNRSGNTARFKVVLKKSSVAGR